MPRKWLDPDPPAVLQEIGDEWLKRESTVALKVPSAIVNEEWNYLLNPAHPDFKKLKLSQAEIFRFDRRVARASR